MNIIVPILALSCASLVVHAQQKNITCCSSGAKTFASFTSDNAFVNAHQLPKKYIHKSTQQGATVAFDCPDGKPAHGYVIRSKGESNNWIFVFHEWWGLNDNIKKWEEDLYNALSNVNVLALDMYDGKLTADRGEAREYMQGFSQKRGNAIVGGALDYVGKEARIGTIGWCFGGGQSLQAALIVGNQAVGCVMYYGMPEENTDRLSMLKTDVVNIWATRDKWIDKKVMDKFKKNMTLVHKKLTVYAYDANHAFANPSNPIFDQKAAEDAKQKVLAYFKMKMN